MLSFATLHFFFQQNSQKSLTCKTSNTHLSQYKYIPTPAEAKSFSIYLNKRQIWKMYNARAVSLSDKKVSESNESHKTYKRQEVKKESEQEKNLQTYSKKRRPWGKKPLNSYFNRIHHLCLPQPGNKK